MFLNIKIIAVSLLFSATMLGQDVQQSGPANENENQDDQNPKIGSIYFGAYAPIAIGDNFINNGFNLKTGGMLRLKFNFFEDFYVGPTVSFFSGDVTNTDFTGNYNKTTNLTFGSAVGYEKQLDKFIISLSAGVGATVYANKVTGDNFNDTATTIWISPEFTYKFSSYFGAFIAPEYRHDFTNINAPDRIKDSFNGVDYINISVGFRIFFGTGYKIP